MTGNRVLSVLQGFVGITAVGGGGALMLGPDGHYLQIGRGYLAGSPFADFFLPGLLLAVFVGGGGLLAAVLSWLRAGSWQPLGLVYALGLIVFEVVESLMIGFQVLQAFEFLLALLMLGLVSNSSRRTLPAQAAR